MKIIIDIPEKMYKDYVSVNLGRGNGKTIVYNLLKAIKHGTPLPKNHGRLIDAEKIANDINALKDNWNRYRNEYESGRYESYDYAVDTIEDAPTIIEADKEGDNNDTYT